MHFIGMLAYVLPIERSYDPWGDGLVDRAGDAGGRHRPACRRPAGGDDQPLADRRRVDGHRHRRDALHRHVRPEISTPSFATIRRCSQPPLVVAVGLCDPGAPSPGIGSARRA